MEKLDYVKPTAEIVRFENGDVITKSCTGRIYDYMGWDCLWAGLLKTGQPDGSGDIW